MKSTLLLGALLATTGLIRSQELEITGFDTGLESWGTETTNELAAIRYDEQPGEHTLLMVHTTVDAAVAGKLVAKGISEALEFMVAPDSSDWSLLSPELAGMTGYSFSGQAPMVPPRRIRKHLLAFEQSQGQQTPPTYGTHNPGTAAATAIPNAGIVSTPTLITDERRPWSSTAWSQNPEELSHFTTAPVGRESVILAAHEWQSLTPNAPAISASSIDALNAFLDSSVGFDIYVQAIHVKFQTIGNKDVRVSRHVRIRRRSLFQGDTPRWQVLKGHDRFVPHPQDADVNVWLAPRADEMHIIFPQAVGSMQTPVQLRAYVPTTNGYVTVDQTPNPIEAGAGGLNYMVDPDKAIFPCPTGIVDGIVYFQDIATGGSVFANGTVQSGSLIKVFTPPTPPAPPVP